MQVKKGGEQMRRWLTILSLLGSLALLGAGAASATVTYDSGTWFIGRGDVIGNVGKAALVEQPRVDWYAEGRITGTCVFDDGTTSAATGSWFHWVMYYAQPRYAPGNGTITGYTAGWNDIFTGMDSFGFNCAGGIPPTSGVHLVDTTNVITFERLTFEGGTIPGPYPPGA
jgi:hypothetical protein